MFSRCSHRSNLLFRFPPVLNVFGPDYHNAHQNKLPHTLPGPARPNIAARGNGKLRHCKVRGLGSEVWGRDQTCWLDNKTLNNSAAAVPPPSHNTWWLVLLFISRPALKQTYNFATLCNFRVHGRLPNKNVTMTREHGGRNKELSTWLGSRPCTFLSWEIIK